MTDYYTLEGVVYGKTWGSGKASYPAREIRADTKEELLNEAREKLDSGALDSGMGFESLEGALVNIIEHESIEKDGNKFERHDQVDTISLGDISRDEIKFMVKDMRNRGMITPPASDIISGKRKSSEKVS